MHMFLYIYYLPYFHVINSAWVLSEPTYIHYPCLNILGSWLTHPCLCQEVSDIAHEISTHSGKHFQTILLNAIFHIFTQLLTNIVPMSLTNNKASLVQVTTSYCMNKRWSRIMTHICATRRPEWKQSSIDDYIYIYIYIYIRLSHVSASEGRHDISNVLPNCPTGLAPTKAENGSRLGNVNNSHYTMTS